MSSPFGPYEDIVDLTTEGLFAAILVVGVLLMLWAGRHHRLSGRPGWRIMIAGLALLAIMATLDFGDEYNDNLWVVAGTDTEQILEDLLLPIAGVGMLVAGILRWAPMHAKMAALKAEKQANEIERLREVDAFKTTFLNMAAHELATPLTPIRLQVAMLKEEQLQEPENVAVLERNLKRLERLIHDLLDISRVQTGKMHLKRERLDVRALIEEVEASFKPTCHDKNIDYRSDLGPELELESADESRIGQILYNLVGNAVKFTPEGGTIRVSAHSHGNELVICVNDSGPGLDPQECNAVFLPFQQFHLDMDESASGSGLGLHISQAITDAHGGHIEATSPGRGKGATFTLRLPIHAVGPDAKMDDALPLVRA